MTSRLVLCAAVAATVVLAPHVGASAQTYEVIPLVPGSAFHGVHGLGIDKAELTVVADGFKIPAAVNFDSKSNL